MEDWIGKVISLVLVLYWIISIIVVIAVDDILAWWLLVLPFGATLVWFVSCYDVFYKDVD